VPHAPRYSVESSNCTVKIAWEAETQVNIYIRGTKWRKCDTGPEDWKCLIYMTELGYLEAGQRYEVEVTATNIFGTSDSLKPS